MSWFANDASGLLDPIVALMVVANLTPILPVVLDVVSPLPPRRRRRTGLSALLIGNIVAFLFATGGGALLRGMQSQIADIRVAGGLILLVFAIYDLLFSREQRKEPLGEIAGEETRGNQVEVGLVPLGIPIMVGPATLTTALVVAEAYGIGHLIVAMIVNGLINAGILLGGQRAMDLVGHGAVRATGKVFGLLLATMAISMIRTGISSMVAG